MSPQRSDVQPAQMTDRSLQSVGFFCIQPEHLAPQPLGVWLGLVMLSYEETDDRKVDGIRLLANNL